MANSKTIQSGVCLGDLLILFKQESSFISKSKKTSKALFKNAEIEKILDAAHAEHDFQVRKVKRSNKAESDFRFTQKHQMEEKAKILENLYFDYRPVENNPNLFQNLNNQTLAFADIDAMFDVFRR